VLDLAVAAALSFYKGVALVNENFLRLTHSYCVSYECIICSCMVIRPSESTFYRTRSVIVYISNIPHANTSLQMRVVSAPQIECTSPLLQRRLHQCVHHFSIASRLDPRQSSPHAGQLSAGAA
jgi:hypothetical protein